MDTLKEFSVDLDTSQRFDCPTCGHKNTLSISRSNGWLKWYCFSASCSERGVRRETLTVEDLAKVLQTPKTTQAKPFEIPEWFVYPEKNSACMNYLHDNHCEIAIERDLVEVWYDVRMARCVFLIYNYGHRMGGVGRDLVPSAYAPKWYNYGDTSLPLMLDPCGTNRDTLIIVEDAASACAASTVISAAAIRGTTLTDEHIKRITRDYDKFIVALDKDASEKGLAMARQLSSYGSASVLLLERDLKYLNQTEIKGLLL